MAIICKRKFIGEVEKGEGQRKSRLQAMHLLDEDFSNIKYSKKEECFFKVPHS